VPCDPKKLASGPTQGACLVAPCFRAAIIPAQELEVDAVDKLRGRNIGVIEGT